MPELTPGGCATIWGWTTSWGLGEFRAIRIIPTTLFMISPPILTALGAQVKTLEGPEAWGQARLVSAIRSASTRGIRLRFRSCNPDKYIIQLDLGWIQFLNTRFGNSASLAH